MASLKLNSKRRAALFLIRRSSASLGYLLLNNIGTIYHCSIVGFLVVLKLGISFDKRTANVRKGSFLSRKV